MWDCPTEQFARRYPHELSGGQRQRVGPARALAVDPPILLMDEPFGALDPLTSAEMQREFKLLRMRLGTTVAFVTHDITEALGLGDRIVLMDSGASAGVFSRKSLSGLPMKKRRPILISYRSSSQWVTSDLYVIS